MPGKKGPTPANGSKPEFLITHKEIRISGRKFVIYKQTFAAQLHRFSLMEAAEKSLNGNAQPSEEEGIESLVRRRFTLSVYPSLVACTSGPIFTEAECYQMELDDLNNWLALARELNPDWFPILGENVQEEAQEEKKD